MRQRCNTVSDEVASLALEVGWRSIFFTSKLQLQKLISRRKQKTEGQQEGQVSHSETKAEDSHDDTFGTFGSEEVSHPGIIPELSPGNDTNMDSETSSYCDIDPVLKPEPEASFDSFKSLPD